MMRIKNRTTLTAGFIIACGAFMRLLFLLNSDNFHGIAAGKLIETLRLLKHPGFLYSWIVPAHGPIHLYLMALGIKLFGNPIAVGRWLSYCAGVAVLLPFYGLLRRAFNKDTAMVGVFAGAFFPLHMVYSGLSTAETTFLFFLFTGLLFFIRHERGGSFRDLIVAALCVGLSSLCRFEGGIVIGLLSALLLREPKKLFVFGGIAACLPVVWVAGNYVLFGNPFYFLTASDAVVRWEFNKLNAYGIDHTFWRKVPYWPLQCKDYFGWPVFVMGIYGVGRWALKKKNRMFSVVFIGLLCVFMVKTTRERLAMESRYGMSLGFLFLGFFSRAFVGIARAIKPSHAKIMLMVFFLLVTVRGTYIGLTKLPRIPQRLRQTAEFLRRNITLCGNEAIYVDCDEDNFKEPIKLFSGIDVDRFVDFESTASHIELLQPADRERIKYIVLVSWTRTLPRYKEIFRTDECRIYQIRK